MTAFLRLLCSSVTASLQVSTVMEGSSERDAVGKTFQEEKHKQKKKEMQIQRHTFTPGHEGAEGVGAKRPLGGSDRKGGSFRKTNLWWGGRKKRAQRGERK